MFTRKAEYLGKHIFFRTIVKIFEMGVKMYKESPNPLIRLNELIITDYINYSQVPADDTAEQLPTDVN